MLQRVRNLVIIALQSICYAFNSEVLIVALCHEPDISSFFFSYFGFSFGLDILYDCSDLQQMKDFFKRRIHKGQVLLFCIFLLFLSPLIVMGGSKDLKSCYCLNL